MVHSSWTQGSVNSAAGQIATDARNVWKVESQRLRLVWTLIHFELWKPLAVHLVHGFGYCWQVCHALRCHQWPQLSCLRVRSELPLAHLLVQCLDCSELVA